ncbi:MAG: hypothetical protein HY868_04015 [Chloroflexi bacterium]|nr:hypothetical protein [Chloroflexota bacterium]
MPLQGQFRSAALRASLALKANPRAVNAALSKRASQRPRLPTRDRVTVAAIQMPLLLVHEVAPFVEQCERLAWQAVERGAQLIVFPEYSGLPLLGLLPSLRDLAGLSAPFAQVIAEPDTRAFLPLSQRLFETLGATLAARFSVYVMMGTTITNDSAGRLFNTAFLFSPEGRRAGTWDKLFAAEHEADWMIPGEDLRVLTLPFAQISVLLGADCQYWEAARLAMLRGADIILSASGEPRANEATAGLRGMASRAQESLAFGVQARAVTELFGLSWGGPSAILAPVGLRQTTSAFVARTHTPNVEEVIVADLDLAALRELRDAQPRDWNVELYRKYLARGFEV